MRLLETFARLCRAMSPSIAGSSSGGSSYIGSSSSGSGSSGSSSGSAAIGGAAASAAATVVDTIPSVVKRYSKTNVPAVMTRTAAINAMIPALGINSMTAYNMLKSPFKLNEQIAVKPAAETSAEKKNSKSMSLTDWAKETASHPADSAYANYYGYSKGKIEVSPEVTIGIGIILIVGLTGGAGAAVVTTISAVYGGIYNESTGSGSFEDGFLGGSINGAFSATGNVFGYFFGGALGSAITDLLNIDDSSNSASSLFDVGIRAVFKGSIQAGFGVVGNKLASKADTMADFFGSSLLNNANLAKARILQGSSYFIGNFVSDGIFSNE